MMVRVRVKARNFKRLEPTGGPPKREGGVPPRAAVSYPLGSELTISRALYEAHKGTFQLLGEDLASGAGEDRTPDSTPDDLEALRAEAEDLGIVVDKRWREGRLRDEIAKAEDELEEGGDGDPDAE